MKQLRKSFLTLLALTLFGGAGAWAQGVHVTFFDVPDSWNGDNTYITAADLEGFHSITAYEAQAGASIQPEGVVYLFYAINGQNVSMLAFASGMFGGSTTEPVTRNAFYAAQHEGVKIYYSSVIELTPSSNNTVWTLGQTPDYDLELQVEYYEPHALKNIPAGWQVMVNGADKTNLIAGDSLMITETDSVTLVPDGNPRRVKSVTLVDLTPDLATVTTDITVEDGCTLTGTLGANVKISIADGATVTLDGMTINGENDGSYSWAGITCLGDATIILSGTNTVKGFHINYPGIYVPENKTLTIEGSGSLTASSNGFGCGIGGGRNIACGNIVIAGGTVNATGGSGAAGIGSCYNAGCGTISITGGTVTATGGGWAAGIGSGFSGSCGTVTITDGVTSVTATKGDDADYSIGAGKSGSCGTVTIGGTTGFKSQSPYTYPQN